MFGAAKPVLQPVPTPDQVLTPVQQPVGTPGPRRQQSPSFLSQIALPPPTSPNRGGKSLLGA